MAFALVLAGMATRPASLASSAARTFGRSSARMENTTTVGAMITLRPFEPDDLEVLYAISLATGDAGGDASRLHDDPRLIGHIYSAPYALLAPDLAVVAADGAGVAGYVVGALDTAAWEERLERDWWPKLRREYRDPGGGPREAWTADQRRAFVIHHPGRTPPALTDAYPAHIHLNLLPRVQRRGVGSALLDAWLRLAAARGAGAAHVGVNRGNAGGLRFWEARGFTTLTLEGLAAGRTVWMGRS
jgi:GNAT superfamily N-acetyltransferase